MVALVLRGWKLRRATISQFGVVRLNDQQIQDIPFQLES